MDVRRGLVRRERQELLAMVRVPCGELNGTSLDGDGRGVIIPGVTFSLVLE